jgi:hypothetical protein
MGGWKLSRAGVRARVDGAAVAKTVRRTTTDDGAKETRMTKLFALAFEEWNRRYRENQDEFMSVATALLEKTPATYGDACAVYFQSLLADVMIRGEAVGAAKDKG